MKKIYLMYPQKIGKISPEIYGHFTEHIGGVIYDGIWVGKNSDIPNINGFRKDIIEKLKKIKAPVIRWPGGCFAETYDWRDGIGENRPTRVNWWTKRDGRYESNEVGTHEFMNFCESIGAKAYFAANLTSVSPLHILNWVDYCLSPRNTTSLAIEREKNGHPEPFDIPFWGVGNENWGGGGNMTPTFYADEYRRFAALLANFPTPLKLIGSGANSTDYEWTKGFLENTICKNQKNINGYSLHYYCGISDGPLDFSQDGWYNLLKNAAGIEEVILRHWNIISGYNMEEHCKLVIDEWGCWHIEGTGPSKGYNLFEQQSSIRDAMVTALTLNIFNNHCDKIMMANAAQLVNNLHALFLSNKENCITTPTYHIFDMYKEHQGGQAVKVTVTENEEFENSITVSASVKNNKTLITIGNLSCTEDTQIILASVDKSIPETAKGVLLFNEDMHAHNTFASPHNVKPVEIILDLNQPINIPKTAVLAIQF